MISYRYHLIQTVGGLQQKGTGLAQHLRKYAHALSVLEIRIGLHFLPVVALTFENLKGLKIF